MDLITQVQDKLDHLLYVFGTCIGVLQRDAPPSSFTPQQQPPQEPWEVPPKMAIQVIETSKLIESYIEKLPGFDKTEDEQYEDLRNLNNESKEISAQHQMSRNEAIEVLKLVKDSIRFISEESKKVEKEEEEEEDKLEKEKYDKITNK
ncbi:hypothetical protein DICPUDRAFT_100091 [Dictyostelium purpureum]|uniref:Mediator of RNA polymerase II transcription subunit 21 n=1 Tax=Dictyostelium purpureum TaxID=5786 RepID=F1A5D6_DICPU|nr:uncharacterized protein DICPUDRAFT_100091 [Dictyostelium purpureum]EGC28590.1 hypothetical protein DICPUDRAFT_100091 [Dictyostelium purpureum]|eukprot:XP_003294879.1 hypothetical protein DICPUDRAFT_100091 [Dictyostelium purpureum]